MNRPFQEFGRQKNRSKKVEVGWDLDQWSPSTDRVWPDVRDPPPTKSHQDSQSHQDEGLSIPPGFMMHMKQNLLISTCQLNDCLMQRSRLCTLYFELQQSGWNWSPAQLPACNVKALRIYCWATSYSVSTANTAKQAWLMRKMTRQRQSLDRKGDAIVLQL